MTFFKRNWLLTLFVIAALGISGYFLYLSQQPPQLSGAPTPPASQAGEPPAQPKPPVGDTSQGGHWHGDEWHAEPHEAGMPPAESQVQHTAPPGAVTKPDFASVDPNEDPLEAAYKRLDYISKNIYAWGGVSSPRTTELIAQLMPPPVLRDEGHGEEVELLIEELIAQGDPRAAKVLITNMCDGYIGGGRMMEALVEIGPPAVPDILPYVREDFVMAGIAIDILARIAEQYRDDLGGIVEHIIIPKLEVIAADTDFEHYDSGTFIDAQEALARLQR